MEHKRQDSDPVEGSPANDHAISNPDGWVAAELALAEQRMTAIDPVDHPPHYTRSNFEPIDVIEDWQLGFCLGNTVKYIARAGHKDPAKTVEDLKKARWYLDRYIAQLEGSR